MAIAARASAARCDINSALAEPELLAGSEIVPVVSVRAAEFRSGFCSRRQAGIASSATSAAKTTKSTMAMKRGSGFIPENRAILRRSGGASKLSTFRSPRVLLTDFA